MNGTQRIDRIIAITVALLLTAGCIVVLYPFVSALLWAVILCFVTWPTFLWGVLVVGAVDNVIKPYLIGRGSDLPFILVLLGVLGGAFAFGVIGIFLGPTLLAVGYTVVRDWTLAEPVAAATAPGLEQG
jgi:predicted PurR-regulated permease PerM